MAKKKKQTRPRGGASYPCPECGRASSVLTTRRLSADTPPGSVQRRRQCASCGLRFTTHEVLVEGE